MVSFELGKEIERDAFRLVISEGQRKDSESPRGIQPQIFVSIPPPVRSVFVVTNLQFGKRSLPFSCNLSITATRDLSFWKVPPGSYHLNLNFIVGFTWSDILNDVYYFENRTQTKYFVAKKNHLISNFVAAAPCNYHQPWKDPISQW